jgi:hypothetical protein
MDPVFRGYVLTKEDAIKWIISEVNISEIEVINRTKSDDSIMLNDGYRYVIIKRLKPISI